MLNVLSGTIHQPIPPPPEPEPSTDKRRAEDILGVDRRTDAWDTTLEITPAKAQMLLAAMPAQRPLYRHNVERFRILLRSGRFRKTHQGIAFNIRGDLMDGQHRLAACVETDIPIVVRVFFNEPSDNFAYIDRGRPRTLSDDLTTRTHTGGGSEGAILQAAIRIIWHLESNRSPWQTGGAEAAPPLAEAEAILTRRRHLLEASRFAMTHSRRGLPASALAAFYALFLEADAAKADAFITQIVKGENLQEGDPAYACRLYLERLRDGKRTAARAGLMIALVRCWNSFHAGRRLQRVDTKTPGDVFPKIVGLKG
jgi:hypothetical protein